MKKIAPFAWFTCLALLSALPCFSAEETAVVKDGKVNVRGQPSLAGEVVTQLQKGEKVVILEEVKPAHPKTNDPPVWARIQMPNNTPVWIYADLVDTNSKSIKVPRANLRAGPGENFSVVGRLPRGAVVNEIRRVEDWLEIETPPGAYGFVAANLLSKVGPGNATTVAATPPVTSPPPMTTPADLAKPPVLPPPVNNGAAAQPVVPNAPPIISPTVQQAKAAPPAASGNPLAEPPKTESTRMPTFEPMVTEQTVAGAPKTVASTPKTVAPAPAPVASAPVTVPSAPATVASTPAAAPVAKATPEDGLVRRVVRREGLVRSTTSIQAPTYYELLNPDNRKTINYLHTDKLDVNLKDYRGRRIIVTGEEAIDPRWPKTPVIEVEHLELIP
jgi:SH3-like domain-containing protein